MSEPTDNRSMPRRWMSKLGTKILSFCLPYNSKRSLLLTSLFVEIARISPEHQQLLQSLRFLNDRLKIASHTDAMLLPAHIHRRLWGRDTVGDLDANPETADQAKLLLSRTPSWMRYATVDQMQKEIAEVIRLGRLQKV